MLEVVRDSRVTITEHAWLNYHHPKGCFAFGN
jgi:hypothetical protein